MIDLATWWPVLVGVPGSMFNAAMASRWPPLWFGLGWTAAAQLVWLGTRGMPW